LDAKIIESTLDHREVSEYLGRIGPSRQNKIALRFACSRLSVLKIDPNFLDEKLDHPGKLRRPYILELPTQQVSIQLLRTDPELVRKLARRRGISRYQTYIKSLLHDTLVKEAAGEG
jgi:hypothetical protein